MEIFWGTWGKKTKIVETEWQSTSKQDVVKPQNWSELTDVDKLHENLGYGMEFGHFGVVPNRNS